ncbi:MAG: hypothetical protein IH863_09420 [Chloroflexi bacterium]|nr:hypothetical protein [Chloroflexota bacterium]
MPVLLLEEHRPGLSPVIIASSSDRFAIAAFWRAVLQESEDVVRSLEETGDEALAALERAERERLRRIAGLFGGEGSGDV